MKIAALDLGSNTFLCLICEVKNNQISKVYSDQVEVVRLGQDLQKTKKIHPDALSRAKKCLEKFSEIIQKEKPDRILAMATSAARDAENKQELFKICQDLNIPLEIIAGEKEAEITYQGAISKTPSEKNRLVIDIGGGSTEFIFGSGSKLIQGQSLNIGCVRLTEKFISAQPTTENEVTELKKFISNEISKINSSGLKIDEVLAVAGTPTTLAAVEIGKFQVDIIDGYIFKLDRLEKWLSELIPLSIAEKILKGFPEGRADVILVGLIILIEALKYFNKDRLVVSTRGVRYGVALDVAGR